MPDFRAFKTLWISLSTSEEITLIWFYISRVMSRSYQKHDTLISQVAFGTSSDLPEYTSRVITNGENQYRDRFVKLLKALIEIRPFRLSEGTYPVLPETK